MSKLRIQPWLRLRGPSLLTVLLAAGLACAWQSARPAQSRTTHVPPAPMVLQGRITEVTGNAITIRTPQIRPTYTPGRPMPMFIIAGRLFRADVTHATYETPLGQPDKAHSLSIGDSVVIVADPIVITGTTPQPWPVTAAVVEKIVAFQTLPSADPHAGD